MPTNKDREVSILNDLIETCRDGELGFRAAAEGTDDNELKSLFNRYSQQRAQFASDLRMEVTGVGGDPANRGTVGGAMHRGWINIKSAVTGKDLEAIINECERGEDVAKENYKKALASGDLSEEVRSLVHEQSMEVQEAHDRIRALQRTTEKSGRRRP